MLPLGTTWLPCRRLPHELSAVIYHIRIVWGLKCLIKTQQDAKLNTKLLMEAIGTPKTFYDVCDHFKYLGFGCVTVENIVFRTA